jgi:DNA-binding NarL/FixJ family response regulator
MTSSDVRADRDRAALHGQPLLDTEREVLVLASHGLTNHQIGTWCGVTAGAVKTRMRKVLAKLDAIDRAHAVRRGFEAGYLRADLRGGLRGGA